SEGPRRCRGWQEGEAGRRRDRPTGHRIRAGRDLTTGATNPSARRGGRLGPAVRHRVLLGWTPGLGNRTRPRRSRGSHRRHGGAHRRLMRPGFATRPAREVRERLTPPPRPGGAFSSGVGLAAVVGLL